MKLFVFPLGQSVLQPGSSRPLHIFEERYLQMVRDALLEKIPIAIAFVDGPEGSSEGPEMPVEGALLSFLRPVAGYGFPEILEERPDGSLLILVNGVGKVRLGPLIEAHRPYLMVEAEPLQEDQEITADQALQYLALQRHLVSWIGEHVQDVEVREQLVRSLEGPSEVIGTATSFLVTDPDFQQLILEQNDLNSKINLISGLLMTGQAN